MDARDVGFGSHFNAIQVHSELKVEQEAPQHAKLCTEACMPKFPKAQAPQ